MTCTLWYCLVIFCKNDDYNAILQTFYRLTVHVFASRRTPGGSWKPMQIEQAIPVRTAQKHTSYLGVYLETVRKC